MKPIIPIIAALLTIAAIASAVVGDMPVRSLPLKPRHEWKAVKLDGYVVDATTARWIGMIGGPDKEFAWTNSMGFGPRETRTLLFADKATRLRAEQLQGVPVCVTAIEVTKGGVSFWLAESITELK